MSAFLGAGAAVAQTAVNGVFSQHVVTITGRNNCAAVDNAPVTYTTSSVTIAFSGTCDGGSVGGQLVLTVPPTIVGATPSSDSNLLALQSPFSLTMDVSGVFTAPDGSFSGLTTLGTWAAYQLSTCPSRNNWPKPPAGQTNFSMQYRCDFTSLNYTSDNNGQLIAVFGPHAYVGLWNQNEYPYPTILIDIVSTYVFPSKKVVTDDVPADPFTPRQTTDSRFVGSNPTKCVKRSGGPLTLPVSINRVVGAVQADGTLSFAQQLVAGQVVSQYAHLRMPVFHRSLTGAGGSARDRLVFNTESGFVASLTGAGESWSMNEFDVPIGALHFGKRNPGDAPAPGRNVLQVQIDADSSPGENWCTAVDWAEVSFNAVAPVIMIHGNGQGDDGQGGQFWAGSILGDDGRLQLPFKFIDALDSRGVPYDNSISMPSATIAAHGNLLATLIPAKAAEFGARHVHLVAHSKGGLDSRDFLARTIPPNFGVLSLTTLSTPHHGSAGPDYQLDSVGAAAAYSDDATRTLIGQQVQSNGGTANLRVSFVEDFNRGNIPLLPTHLTVDGEERPVVYQSISADANLDDSTSAFGNPTIQYNETTGIPGQGSHFNTTWAFVLEQVYRIIGNVVSTHTETINVPILIGETTVIVPVKVVRETLSPGFILNDFAVNLNEARIAPFVELASVKANHSTIASPDVAQLVINAILKVQPVQ